jgi:RNA recognition motif-containing protein
MENDTETEPVGSSRIYVAGLPTYLDEKRLRETFSERGEVTDAKIMRTRLFFWLLLGDACCKASRKCFQQKQCLLLQYFVNE